MQTISSAEFVQQSKSLIAEMGTASTLAELHTIWRSNHYPYHIAASDPRSQEYLNEILDVYQQLNGVEYDTIRELTSNKQTPDQFRIGYPWVSGSLSLVAGEIQKTVQVMSELERHVANPERIVEFGSGWGNLAIPLARAGKHVTAVDIDGGFLSRMMEEAEFYKLDVTPVQADFIDASESFEEKFDAIIFCSSFHHCLEFQTLLKNLREKVLNPDGGRIFFFAEPISEAFALPWGLRYDGESIWAIGCNGWLELGFSESFFREVAAASGLSVERVHNQSGSVGDYWVASAI